VYPFIRLTKVTLLALAGRSLEPLEESRVPMRVWLNDIDTNLHLNNGRYLTLMDLGRWDLSLRIGMVGPILNNRWLPLVGAVSIRFLRPLGTLRRFELVTRLAGWDHKWFVMEQEFHHHGKIKASALVRVLFKGRHGTVSPSEVARAMGHTGDSPRLSPETAAWLARAYG